MTIEITVKTLSGETLNFDVNSSDTVAEVKRLIKDRIDVPPGQQRLVFRARLESADHRISSVIIKMPLPVLNKVTSSTGIVDGPSGRLRPRARTILTSI
jgi:hypothetical protein